KFFYDNAMMGIQMMEQGRVFGIEKFVAIGTICAYPKFTPVPFKEVNLWDGYPEETNAPYGMAKKMLLVQAQAYKQQYDFNAIYLLPVNLYGPRENFDLENSHVIPAIIRKCIESNINSAQLAISESQSCITIWGTGNPTREFLYVEDAAEGIILATEKYNKTDPVNLGSGSEISIKELVKLIVKLTNFKGNIVWDTSKPDGQPRRRLDTTKAEKEFGFKAKTSLEEGLMQMIEWYMKNKATVVC
ncbi:MAG TPA: NAD-dependent epimerase/dehydratase family protein, partial [Candidatus Wunengus sp. YC63]|uniref:NAD-dependent epimerase/dehydratase family protein n=1 Tax=Candidatus Wunengus sp. YC63 TaxID=3367699 RepID=UPI004024B6BA